MSNGRLAAGDLGTIAGTGHRVRRDLVAQTDALRQAFAARFGKPLALTDSYRPYSVQERIFRQRYTPDRVTGVDPRWWNGRLWWRLPNVAAAAVPGTSNHGWGQAIDWASRVNASGSAEHLWMVANAPRFGWAWPSWARKSPTFEPWHFEAVVVAVANYRDYLTEHGIPTLPDLTAPEPLTPIAPEDDDMPTIIRRRTADGSASLIVGAHSIPGLGKYSLRAIAETYPDAKTVVLGEQDYDTMLALHPPVTTDILAAKVAERVLSGLPNADAETIRAAVRQGFHDLVLRADTTP